LAIMMTVSFEPGNSLGRRIRKAMTSNANRNTKNLPVTLFLRIAHAPIARSIGRLTHRKDKADRVQPSYSIL